MRTEFPRTRNEIYLAAYDELLHLAFQPEANLQAHSPPTFRSAVLAAENGSLTRHIAGDTQVRRLAVIMSPVAHQATRQMADAASGSSQSQDEIQVAGVFEFVVPVKPQSVMRRSAHE